jgi:hypothetical protein
MIDEEINRLQKRIDKLQRAKQLTLSQPFPNEKPLQLPDDILPPYNYPRKDWYLKLSGIKKAEDSDKIDVHFEMKRGIEYKDTMLSQYDNRVALSTWLEQAELEHYYKLKQNHNQDDDNVSQTAG